LWEPGCKSFSWAAAGYAGAISSGKTTCGLLIGSSIAISLKHGKGLSCIPLEEETKRNAAITETADLYRDFIENFESSNCATLIDCDFAEPGEYDRYHKEQVYTNTCFRFFNHVMQRFIEADKKGAEKN